VKPKDTRSEAEGRRPRGTISLLTSTLNVAVTEIKYLDVIDLGLMPYQQAWDLQKAVQKRLIDEKMARRSDPSVKFDLNAKETPTAKGNPAAKADLASKRSNDLLLFVEHPHVYTLGKSGDGSHLLAAAGVLDRIGATYVKIDRGGDITYHGPGQVVGYPIIDLDRHYTDIHRYLRELEEVMIRVCADYGLSAGRIDGLTGVWIGDEKICAFGVKCSRWVTMHGFAFNVNTALDYFGHIVPCGITGKKVTSLQQLLGRTIDLDDVKKRITGHFETVFGVTAVGIDHLPELV
jgi:lipoyl(octanoyl) transferase